MSRNRQMIMPQALTLLVACCVLVIIPTAAFADAGIPLIACIYPGFWLLLPAVVLIEGIAAFIILRRGAWCALKVAAVSNILSTLAGIPLKWIFVLALTPLAHASKLPFSEYSPNLFRDFAFNVLCAPFGLGFFPEGSYDEVKLCWIFLLIPFFLLSVWIEGFIAKRLLNKEDRGLAVRWAWWANIASYTLIVATFWYVFGFTWWWLENIV